MATLPSLLAQMQDGQCAAVVRKHRPDAELRVTAHERLHYDRERGWGREPGFDAWTIERWYSLPIEARMHELEADDWCFVRFDAGPAR